MCIISSSLSPSSSQESRTMMKELLLKALGRFGYRITRTGTERLVVHYPPDRDPTPDLEREFLSLYEKCRAYTLTSIERMYALYKAVEYIVKHGIPGDMVECGVWRGGSSMLIASTLTEFNATRRRLYLYDTYSGMSKPTEEDVDYTGNRVIESWEDGLEESINRWNSIPLDEVKRNMSLTGYPGDNLVFVQGKVEDTIPAIVPQEIALLRLDTDFYESTYHELVHLFPRLSPHGVLIVDDYGHWKGARKAVDKYLAENSVEMLLQRIDYTGRIGVRP